MVPTLTSATGCSRRDQDRRCALRLRHAVNLTRAGHHRVGLAEPLQSALRRPCVHDASWNSRCQTPMRSADEREIISVLEPRRYSSARFGRLRAQFDRGGTLSSSARRRGPAAVLLSRHLAITGISAEHQYGWTTTCNHLSSYLNNQRGDLR